MRQTHCKYCGKKLERCQSVYCSSKCHTDMWNKKYRAEVAAQKQTEFSLKECPFNDLEDPLTGLRYVEPIMCPMG